MSEQDKVYRLTKEMAEEEKPEGSEATPAEEVVEEPVAEAVDGEEKKEEESSEVESEAKSEEAATAEQPVEEAKADEELEKSIKSEINKLKNDVLRSVDRAIKKNLPSKETKSIKEKLNMDHKSVSFKEQLVPVYTKRNGQRIKMEKSALEMAGKWLYAVASKRYDLADKFFDQMQTKLEPMNDTNDAGLTPTILTDVLIDIQDDLSVIRPRATVLDLSGPGNIFEFNQVTGQPHMTWTGENVNKSTTSMTTNAGSLTPYKLAGIVSVTLELLQDAKPNVVSMVISNLGRALAREEERAFAAGSGSGRPTGINTYTYRTVSAGGTLDYLDFTTAYSRLGQAYRDNAVWLMNGRTMGAVLGMMDTTNRPIAVEGGVDHLTGRPIRTLLGAPILEQNDIESTSIFFINLSYYYIGDKMQTTIRQSDVATVAGVSAFERNLVHILAEKRVDGEMLDTNAGVEITDVLVS